MFFQQRKAKNNHFSLKLFICVQEVFQNELSLMLLFFIVDTANQIPKVDEQWGGGGE